MTSMPASILGWRGARATAMIFVDKREFSTFRLGLSARTA